MNTDLTRIQKALRGSVSGDTLSQQANTILNYICGVNEEFKLGEMITLSYHDFTGVSSSTSYTFNGLYTGDEFLLVLCKPQNTSNVELGLCPIFRYSSSNTVYGVWISTLKNSSNNSVQFKATYNGANVTVTAVGPLSWGRVLLIRVPGLLT